MSVFPEKEELYNVYAPSDSQSTKKTSYPGTPTFTVMAHIIRITAEESLVFGEELGNYVANVEGPSSFNIKRGYLLKNADGTKAYTVKNKPRRYAFLNKVKLHLAEV